MAKILLSIPDEVLEKIDKYRDKKKIKRNQFFIDAVEKYFETLWEDDYFERKKQAFERIQEIRKKIGVKDWDPVAEIREIRESAEKEVLKKLS